MMSRESERERVWCEKGIEGRDQSDPCTFVDHRSQTALCAGASVVARLHAHKWFAASLYIFEVNHPISQGHLSHPLYSSLAFYSFIERPGFTLSFTFEGYVSVPPYRGEWRVGVDASQQSLDYDLITGHKPWPAPTSTVETPDWRANGLTGLVVDIDWQDLVQWSEICVFCPTMTDILWRWGFAIESRVWYNHRMLK